MVWSDGYLAPRILLSTTELNAKQREAIQSASPGITIETSEQLDSFDLEKVEIILLSDNSLLTSERIQNMKRLRFIQTLWAGVDSMDFRFVPDSVLVCGNVGGFSEPIAEHVFGMVICLARNLREHDQDLRRGIFDRSTRGLFLKGKKICVLGTGGIGQAVAKLAKAFGMATIGINTKGRIAPYFDRTGSLPDLDSFLAESNVIVIALPLTARTKNLFDSRRLNLLMPDCILVDVGRAKIIDQKALYDYLLSHTSVKFATDVWWKYPGQPSEKFAQDYPFFNLPNFMGSPHDADFVPEAHEIAMDNAIQNIARFLRNETPRGIAKKEDYVDLQCS